MGTLGADSQDRPPSLFPAYKNWFRVEWEGLEKIPVTGGALLVSNHAAAIPSDAP